MFAFISLSVIQSYQHLFFWLLHCCMDLNKTCHWCHMSIVDTHKKRCSYLCSTKFNNFFGFWHLEFSYNLACFLNYSYTVSWILTNFGTDVDQHCGYLLGEIILFMVYKFCRCCGPVNFLKSLHILLASRDECPGSLCHSPSVGVGVRVGCVDQNFNLGHNFQTRRGRALILHMCIPCGKTFHMVA